MTLPRLAALYLVILALSAWMGLPVTRFEALVAGVAWGVLACSCSPTSEPSSPPASRSPSTRS